MTADPGHAPVRRKPLPRRSRCLVRPPQTNALVERRLPTARECGLGTGEATTGGTRCRDITPELVIELI